MARDPQKLRKAYEYKLGKDLVAKLSDDQITQLSKYYNSLPPDQQSKVDSELVMGKGDFLDTARSMADPIKDPVKNDTLVQKYLPEDKFVDDTQEKLDEKLSETSDSIMDEIDRIIAEYNKKVEESKKPKKKEEEIPEGLDDLLNEIKQETKKEVGGDKKSSALAVIPKKIEEKEEELVDEEIDSRILELLGIEDTTGLDYSDYKSLLKEKMMADRMSGQDIDSGDAELISNEYKRIKGSTGKFKVKGQKIKAESFVGKKKTDPVSKIRRPLLKPISYTKVDQPIKDEGQSNDEIIGLLVSKLNNVDKNVQNTAENIQKKDEAEEAQGEKDRISAEKVADERREQKTERKVTLGNIVKGVKKTVKPLTDMLGGLFDFFKKIGFSIFIMELLRFLENPAKYINDIVKWVNLQIAKLEMAIEDFVIDKIVKPMNGMIDGLNKQISGFVDNINPFLEKLKKIPLIGDKVKTIDEPPQVPKIDESVIRDKVFLGRVPEVKDDFLDGILGVQEAPPAPVLPAPGTTQPGAGTKVEPQVKPQTPMMGQPTPTTRSGGNQQVLLDTIAYAEGTSGSQGYNTWFGGRTDMDLSKMTVNEVVQEQKRRLRSGEATYNGITSAAVGRYQMMYPEEAAKAAGFDPATTLFTPENQDRMVIAKYLKGQAGLTQEQIDGPLTPEIIDKLAPVFASFPNLFGPDAKGRVGTNTSYYGQGGKSESQLMKKYQELLKKSQPTPQPTTSEPPPVGQVRVREQPIQHKSVSQPNIRPPGGGVNIASMSLPGTGIKVDNSKSSAGASQSPVLGFSATDPTNLSVISAKSTYGVVV